MELDGQRMRIYNDTNEIIKDLYYVLPGTNIECKVRKCKSSTHVDEHIFNKYKGDLIFFFKRDENQRFIFEDVIGVPVSEGIFGYDVEHKFSLQFRIVNDDEGHLSILKENYVD
ncbi:hypothetical protein [Amedibacillus sp. YH-ame10]